MISFKKTMKSQREQLLEHIFVLIGVLEYSYLDLLAG